jgi:flagellar biosynthesis protein FliQ
MGELTSDFALALGADTLWTALLVALPVLGLSMVVGLLVSILQVVTQIQEVSLTFIPKVLTVALTLMVFGAWMLNTVVQFATTLISNIPAYF